MTRALLLLLALAWPAVAATGDATVALNFQDVDIPVLAKFVSEVTGRNFIVDERVKGKATIISPTRLTPDEAYLVFQSVLQVKGYTTLPAGSFTKIVPIRDATQSGGQAGDQITTPWYASSASSTAFSRPSITPGLMRWSLAVMLAISTWPSSVQTRTSSFFQTSVPAFNGCTALAPATLSRNGWRS